MSPRTQKKIETKLKNKAMAVLATTYNEVPAGQSEKDIYLWFMQCTIAVTELQEAINAATEVILQDQIPIQSELEV